MNYKLVAIDIDGTLLTDDYRLTEQNKYVLYTAAEAGVHVVLCSGRAPHSVTPLLEEAGIQGYYVAHNGAVAVHSGTQEVLLENGFFMDDVRLVMDYCRARGIHTDFCTAFDMYTESMEREDVREMYAKYLAMPQVLADPFSLRDKLVKFTLFGAQDELDRAYEELTGLNLPVQLLRSGPFYIDVIERATSKGAALRSLAGHLGVSLSETIAIGNYYNDLTMLSIAGVGVAVGNAPDDVKAQADLVVASNNDDGVAEALTRLVLESEQVKVSGK